MTAPTSEQMTQWAREAGFTVRNGVIKAVHSNGSWVELSERLAEFAALAFAGGQTAEREACAKVCDEIESQNFDTNEGGYARDCADAIRARGKAEEQTDYPDEIYLSPENGCEFVYLKGGAA